MLKSVLRLAAILPVLWALGAGGATAKSTLVVQARTKCTPHVQFNRVITKVFDKSGATVARIIKQATSSLHWDRGVRVAEIDLKEGIYRLTVSLWHRKRGIVVTRPIRLELDRRLRVVTVLLTCPYREGRTGRGSAPGDPAPIPQLKKPLPRQSPRSVPPGGLQPDLSKVTSNRCRNSLQGRIAWDYKGSKRWSSEKLNKLCGGAESSAEPARCFQKVMHGNVSYGMSTRWRWQDAVALCAGTHNHGSRVACFQAQIRQGAGFCASISKCRSR